MKIEDIIISSRVRLARNIEGLPFPNKLSDLEQANSVSKAIYEVFGDEYEFRKLKNLSNNQCLMLLEENTISKELIENKDIASYALSNDNRITIMINEEDHIREQCILNGFSLEECYARINAIDERLINKIDIACSNKFGFLTACPTNLGTGMRASVKMFLPALTISGAMPNIIENLKSQGLTVRGLYGEGSNAEGYFYQISNSHTLGISEKDILNKVSTAVKNIEKDEQNARHTLINVNESSIKDMVLRAYGIITNCYCLSTSECVDLLSKIRYGLTEGLIRLKNPKIIDELYITSQPSHLMDYFEIELSPKEREIFRAKYISEILANSKI